MHVWGQGAYGKSLYLPLNFSVNLKLLKKQSLFLKDCIKNINLVSHFSKLFSSDE